MNQTMNKSFMFLAALLVAVSSGFAQTNVSTPVAGFTTLPVRGKSGSANAVTLISLNLARPKAFQGVVGTKSVDGSGRSVITQSTAVFTAGAYDPTGTGTYKANRHYLLIKNGSGAGAWSEVVATTTTSLTLADNLDSLITDGTTQFEIRPFWTFATAFPSGGGLSGANNATAADTVSLILPNGTVTTFFYNTSVSAWRTGVTDATHAVITPSSGVLFTRKQTGAVDITLIGEVLTTPILTDIFAGGGVTGSKLTYVANPYPIESKKLSESGLYTGGSGGVAGGLEGGSSATSADTVTIYNLSTGVPTTYFYHTGNNRWQSGITDASNVTIPDMAVLVINRKNNRGAFEWYIPTPNMSL